MTPSPCIFGRRQERVQHGIGGECQPAWHDLLTAEWADKVIRPNSFRVFQEFEIPARRVLGFDHHGRPCFCAHDYRLMDQRSDDDEEFYETLAYGESVTAWRLHDDRWLVYRRVEPLGEEGATDSEFRVADRMPQ